MAYANPRVVAFSQYLMRDDQPRKGAAAERYSGFETGLRTSKGKKKPAYDAFILPLAVTRYGAERRAVGPRPPGRSGRRGHDPAPDRRGPVEAPDR